LFVPAGPEPDFRLKVNKNNSRVSLVSQSSVEPFLVKKLLKPNIFSRGWSKPWVELNFRLEIIRVKAQAQLSLNYQSLDKLFAGSERLGKA
jgi:hypothetical protein